MGNEIIVKNIIKKAETQALEIDSLEGRAPGEILEDLACFLLGNKDMNIVIIRKVTETKESPFKKKTLESSA